MKILFVSAFPPCEKTAGQDYTRRLVNDLIENGHSVSLIYFEYPEHEVIISSKVNIIMKLTPSLKNCFSKIFLHPFYTKRFNKQLLNYLKENSNEYDMLYLDFSQVHIYSLYIQHPNKVLMCHDVIAQKFSRKNKWNLPWIMYSEKKILKTAKQIITFSNKDSNYIKTSYGLSAKNVNFYLKNGKYNYDSITILNNTFCFYGAWNRAENYECLLWFINNVYSKLNKNINFLIIGGGMDKKLQDIIKQYSNISYLGFVKDPVKEVSKCQALIAPLKKGAGVKVKVIDALSSGTPVIGTSVAFEGITDNDTCKLFYLNQTASNFIKTINEWNNITINYKQKSADEFFNKYNENHFIDYINSK